MPEPSTVRLRVRVTPRATEDRIAGRRGDVLDVRVRAAPADGAANNAVIRVVARALRVAPSRVAVVAGASARIKTLAIEGLDLSQIEALERALAVSDEAVGS